MHVGEHPEILERCKKKWVCLPYKIATQREPLQTSWK